MNAATASIAAKSSPSSSLDKKKLAGRILTGLLTLFFMFDIGIKLIGHPEVAKANAQLGFSDALTIPIALTAALCLALYLVPRTAVLGAVLFTGYLGGAVIVQARVGEPAFNVVFPIVFGAVIWGALALRDSRVRALLWR